MGKNIFWKSVLRRKAILIILILFVGVASFGFALRTIQYLSIHQEIQRISQNYRAIGRGMADEGRKVLYEKS